MNRYLVKRAMLLIPQLLILFVLSFGLVHLTPGATGAVDLNALSGENLAQMRERLGLDRPLPVQFADWLWHAIRLDFGDSFMDGMPVRDKILDRLPATMLLSCAPRPLQLAGEDCGGITNEACTRSMFCASALPASDQVIGPNWQLPPRSTGAPFTVTCCRRRKRSFAP